jgi:hypothetical protein
MLKLNNTKKIIQFKKVIHMKKIKLTSLALVVASAFSFTAQAKSYLSFDIGKTTKQQAQVQLEKSKAKFETNYGYKGYSTDLPIFKINDYEVFRKYGTVKQAWMHFTPANILYKVTVTYADAGSTYKVFKDSLSSKYGTGRNSGGGFNKTSQYFDGDVKVTLGRNEFGFGSDQKTTLSYEFEPALSSVTNMQNRIKDQIAKKNAAKASADL